MEFALNLKKVHFSYKGEKSEKVKLSVKGPGEVKAKDIQVPSTIKIANPERDPIHSAYNVFMKENIAKAVQHDAIDYENLVIAKGSLARQSIQCESPDGDLVDVRVNLSWVNEADNLSSFDTDRLIVAVFNETAQKVETYTPDIVRSNESTTIILPDSYSGEDCHMYIMFVSADMKKSTGSTKAFSFRGGSDLASSVQ